MAEWSIAAVLKTAGLQGSGGSNPPLSSRLFIFPACFSLAEEELSQSAEANYGGS